MSSRHMLLECPALADLRDEISRLVAERSGVMAGLVWAKDRPIVGRYTISPSKTGDVVFNGIAPCTWHVGQHVLPQSASFKYLGLVFLESGSMLPALAKLAQNDKGAATRLNAKHKALMCSKYFPMMRSLFNACAVVKPILQS